MLAVLKKKMQFISFIGSAFINIEPDYDQLEYLNDIFREKRDTFWVIEKKNEVLVIWRSILILPIGYFTKFIKNSMSTCNCCRRFANIYIYTGPAQEFEVFEGAS